MPKNRSIIILCLLLISLILYYFIPHPHSKKSDSNQNSFFSFPFASSTEIEIIKGPEQIILQQQNAEWRLMGKGKNYPADEEKVRSFLEELKNIKIEAVISENPEKYKLFRVDESGIKLQLKSSTQKLNFLFGKRSADFSSQYARILQEKTPRVYALKHRLDEHLLSPFNFWRKKQIFTPDLSAIDFVDTQQLPSLDTGLNPPKAKILVPIPNQEKPAELRLGNKTKNDLYYLQLFGLKDWEGEVVLISEDSAEKLKSKI
ncbi:MAG: DUF4340 domain-containing protein [Deltaproteobacteria bacterium]|nr:DUF4340 domain-containing protein [Deltaproteobacteria bacterium]